ncbi:MAG: SWIM zinc finger family protein [Myxococcota bacterium]
MSSLLRALGGIRMVRAQAILTNQMVELVRVSSGRLQGRAVGGDRYAVSLTVAPLPADAVQTLQQRPIALGRLLSGDVRDSLFWPNRLEDITAHCSCPDGVVWCKHAMALLMLVEDRPEAVLVWRGWTQRTILDATLARPQEDEDGFWRGQRLERPISRKIPLIEIMPEMQVMKKDARDVLRGSVERIGRKARQLLDGDR